MLKFYRYSISTKRIFENMPNYEIRKQILVNPNKNRAKIRYDIQLATRSFGPLDQDTLKCHLVRLALVSSLTFMTLESSFM